MGIRLTATATKSIREKIFKAYGSNSAEAAVVFDEVLGKIKRSVPIPGSDTLRLEFIKPLNDDSNIIEVRKLCMADGKEFWII